MKRTMIAMLLSAGMANVQAQWMETGNSSLDPNTNFIGNTDAVPMNIRTDDIRRFRLNYDENYTLGAFTGMTANGFSLLSPDVDLFYTNSGPGPFSLFHLADGTGDNVQTLGYRPWMRVGLTVTGNADQGYLGHKYTYEDPLDHESGELEDYTDMVIQWSDNPGKWLKDRMRFIFTSAYDESNTGAGSLEGLEAIRLWPKNDSEVNVGLGDFHAGNFADPTNVVEPTERLDVLNGRVRIRQLPDDDACEEDYLVMVVDASSDPGERGVVKWVDPADLPVSTYCDWAILNQGVSGGATPHHLITGIGSDALCPDANDAVAIGFDATAANPSAKLEVKTDVFDVGARIVNETASTTNTALYLNSTGGSQDTYGAYITTQQLEGNNHGVLVEADGAGGGGSNIGIEIRSIVPGTSATADNSGLWSTVEDNGSNAVNVGARFDVNGTGSGADNTGLGVNVVSNGTSSTATGLSAFVDGGAGGDALYGLFSKVQGYSSAAWSYGLRTENLVNGLVNYGILAIADNGTENYGIWAKAPTTCTNCYAVFSEGKQFSTTLGTWTTSDQNYKEDINDFDGGLARILQLQPKTYRFRTEEFEFMNLAQGPQFGLLSQDVESVIPEAVQMIHRPADIDEEGNVQHPEMEIKALNYEMLIPVLIAAVKEQNATITVLQEQVAAAQLQSDAIALIQQQVTGMQAQLAACCANTGSDYRMAPAPANASADELLLGQERLLRIAPNPFTDRTTLYYTTERSGRVQLMANSADGRELRILSEAQREAGAYQFEWSTQDLAPGVYYVTLLLDGEPLVKRAVKVGR